MCNCNSNKLIIGQLSFPVESFAHASRTYLEFRDELDLAADELPEGTLLLHGETFYVSFNGKVWAESVEEREGPWLRVCEPIYNPYC